MALAIREEGGRVREARVVLGGVAPKPWRSEPVEKAITGKRIDAGRAKRAGEAAVKDAEPLDYNEYKIPLLQGLVEESLLAI